MRHRLTDLLVEIKELEKLVADKIQVASDSVSFEFKNGKPVFTAETRRRHRDHIKRLWRFLRDSSILTILTTPVIYSLLLPISLLDLLLRLYQLTCFPIYKIPRVRRSDYVVLDRHRLGYLNLVERTNCAYCDYANGVLGFAREVASRTEQFWCPIKHARRPKGCHARQCLYCEYGDAEAYRRELQELRIEYSDIQQSKAPGQ